MAIDTSQFHQIFFEESFEGLDVMERELMKLDTTNPDNETINTIFRAAHSIKGGGGTFGFKQISSFTHNVETLLDQIRAGERKLLQGDVDLFLQAVDCLRNMLSCLRDKTEINMQQADQLSASFMSLLNHTCAAAPQHPAPQSPGNPEATQPDALIAVPGWNIYFKPNAEVFKTGNEPLRLFRELQKLGNVTVEADTSTLPPLAAVQPDECYLSWRICLTPEQGKPAITEAKILEVFEWVRDESELRIAQGAITTAAPVQALATPGTAVEATAVEAKEAVNRQAAASAANPESSSIRVSIDKIDSLINMVGELVITQSMLGQLGEHFEMSKLVRLQEGLAQLEQNTRELQESVMRIRMLPISFSFSRFPRLVRDLGQKMGKQINLVLQGEQTELDKTVMEKIGDPLVHLVRNAVDHGIEACEVRKAKGKPEAGTVTLNAYHQGGNVIIEIRDDGAGLNRDKILNKALEKKLVKPEDQLSTEQIYNLIFLPGFSTADKITDVSGRGVGMDVVKRNIEALNGTVEVSSVEGQGSIFSICLPLTLAILDGQLVRVGKHVYIFPLISIVESLQIKDNQINQVANGCSVLQLRNEYIPVIKLYEVFNLDAQCHRFEEGLLVVVEVGGEKIGILVDDLAAQQQIVIKSLEQNYGKIEGVSGATILGDGTVALIVDIAGLIRIAGSQHMHLQQQTNTRSQSAGLYVA